MNSAVSRYAVQFGPFQAALEKQYKHIRNSLVIQKFKTKAKK